MYPWWAVLVYWAVTVQCWREACPASDDGYGWMPCLQLWWRLPSVSSAEYWNHRAYYTLLYSTPHAVMAGFTTILGCIAAPLLFRNGRFRTSRLPARAALVTFGVLLVTALASDLATRLGRWQAPVFFLNGGFSPAAALNLARIFLPPALMTAILEAAIESRQNR